MKSSNTGKDASRPKNGERQSAAGGGELASLRAVAAAAAAIFEESGVPGPPTAMTLLKEALRCASEDISDLGSLRGMAGSMSFRRAELRCDLALELVEYLEQGGSLTNPAEPAPGSEDNADA